MDSHLVSVEVSVEGWTHEWMQLNSVTFNKARAECLDTLAVKRWCAVQENVLTSNCFFQDFPYLRYTVFNKAAGATDVEREFALQESCDNEWAEEFQRHVLWKTTLIELKIRTHDNHGTTRVVHALTKKVLAEVSLLTLQVVSE